MKMLFKMAWRNIWRNKRRSIITISSIFCAVFFATFARSFQIGVYNKMIGSMVGMYTGYLQIHQKGYWDEQSKILQTFLFSSKGIPLESTTHQTSNFLAAYPSLSSRLSLPITYRIHMHVLWHSLS